MPVGNITEQSSLGGEAGLTTSVQTQTIFGLNGEFSFKMYFPRKLLEALLVGIGPWPWLRCPRSAGKQYLRTHVASIRNVDLDTPTGRDCFHWRFRIPVVTL